MLGQMQSQPLLISNLIVHAERHHGSTEIVSRRVEGDIHRSNWATVARRSRQVANALDALGLITEQLLALQPASVQGYILAGLLRDSGLTLAEPV